MAASKRRLKDDYDRETVSAPAKKQKIGKRGRAQQDSNKASQPAAGLFQKLPGEIRNQICELSLIDDEKPITLRFGRWRPAKEYRSLYNPDRRALRFREPALLIACKGIRAEALPLYYTNNTFQVAVTTADFYELYDWVMAVQERCGAQSIGRSELHLRSGRWHDLCGALPLAQLFRAANINLANKIGSQTRDLRYRGQVVVPSFPYSSRYFLIEVALGEVTSFGKEARALGHPDTWVQSRFTRWFHEVADCDCHGARVPRRNRLSGTMALYKRHGIDRRLASQCQALSETPEDAKHIAELKIEAEKRKPKKFIKQKRNLPEEIATTSDAADSISEAEQERFDDEDEFA